MKRVREGICQATVSGYLCMFLFFSFLTTLLIHFGILLFGQLHMEDGDTGYQCLAQGHPVCDQSGAGIKLHSDL